MRMPHFCQGGLKTVNAFQKKKSVLYIFVKHLPQTKKKTTTLKHFLNLKKQRGDNNVFFFYHLQMILKTNYSVIHEY